MNRLFLLSLLLVGLLLLGLATLSGKLLALALPLMVYLGAGLLYGPEALNLKAIRRLSTDRASQGESINVKLSIINEASHLEEVFIEDLRPEPLKISKGEPKLLTTLPPATATDLNYTVTGKRGDYRFLGAQITASDHLGLFSRRVTLTAPAQLFVMPEAVRLRRAEIRPRRTRVYSGLIPARQGGPGVEFFGVRGYQPGDALHAINWRAGARHLENLFINEFEQERVADVGLILDARQRSDVISSAGSLFEHAVQATAALADAFLNYGNRVGLLIYGGHLDWTFPGYGKVQRERILRALARTQPGESMAFEELENLPTRLFPVRSQLVLISPLLKDDLEGLMALRGRGYPLLIISPDPISFELKQLEDSPDVNLGARIACLERDLLLRQLRQASIHVLDWNVDIPFHRAAHAFLSRSPTWFRAVGVEP
jgi:uncharacterized protein (DUF58 family)